MSPNYEFQFPIDNISMSWNNIQLALLIVGFFEIVLMLHIFLDRKRIHNFFSEFQSDTKITSNDSRNHSAPTKNRDTESSKNQEKKKIDESVCREEMELVLRNLGIFSNSEEEQKLSEKMDADEISKLFEEKNPSLGEVKIAFDVFDKNGDGFIDAEELQSVLCALGFKEGFEVENCRRMIGVFDENDDGRLDFDEFLKFMETSLC